MNFKINFTIFLVALALGAFLDRKFTVQQVKTEVKEVVQNHDITVTREVVRPDGTKEVDTTVTDTSKKTEQLSKTDPKPLPNWMVGVGYTSTHTYEAYINRRIAGPIFLGAKAAPGQLGVTISVEF